jgi:hypothetical protein
MLHPKPQKPGIATTISSSKTKKNSFLVFRHADIVEELLGCKFS